MIHHMTVTKKKRVTWIPYGHLVSKILKHVSFNIEDEKFVSKSTWVRNVGIKLMRIEINNGIPSQKAPGLRRDS